MFQDFKTEIKLFAAILIVAVVIGVGGVLLLSSLSVQQTKDQIISQRQEEGISLPTQDQARQKELVRFAKRDLADKLRMEESGISEVSVEKAEWPDLSFGCPKEDQAYGQIVNKGYKIILSYKDQYFNYHAGEGYMPFLCGKVQEQNLKGLEDEVYAAKKDLANRLTVDIDSISVDLVGILASSGSGNAIRCPSSEGGKPTSIISRGAQGYQISLSYKEEYYLYSGERGIDPIFCVRVEILAYKPAYEALVYWSSFSTHSGSYGESFDVRMPRDDPRMATELSFFEGNQKISGPVKLIEQDPRGCGFSLTLHITSLRSVKCYRPVARDLKRGSMAEVRLLHLDGEEEIIRTEPVRGSQLTE